MTASKTGLTHYVRTDGKDVYAEKITDIELTEGVQHITELNGSKTLWFGNRKSDLKAEWIKMNNPEIGGWFVVEDVIPTKDHPFIHLAKYITDEDFSKNYVLGD